MLLLIHMNKVIRTICYFTNNPNNEILERIDSLSGKLTNLGYSIQTKRVCSPAENIKVLENKISDKSILLSAGTIDFNRAFNQLEDFYLTNNTNYNVDLTSVDISESHTKMLFEIIKNNAKKTFNFTYVFNNLPSSPYYPSANYEKNGFSVGLQPTDISEGCDNVEQWLNKLKGVWLEINNLFIDELDYLGIDSSVAPLFEGNSSLVNFIKRLGVNFKDSTSTDIYLRITNFIKKENPKPIGLCGLMFPCLEDFDLAQEYENGEFSIERNVFLSLHCGLGIDTYPLGIDENQGRVVQILKLVQGLSNKYHKPLSVRFVSDGKAKIGEVTNFQNQFLKDVLIRKL